METRNCPKCDTMMEYRLGEFECPACGHVEGSGQSVAGIPGKQTKSGPGFQAPPPPPPGAPGPGMPGSTFGGYQGSPLDPPSRGYDSLSGEKNYILIYFACINLLMGFWGMADPQLNSPLSGGGFFVSMLFGTLIGGAILYFVLHTDQMWAKYCCIGCSGLGVLSQVASIVSPTALGQAGMYSPTMQLVSTILNLVYSVWLISILMRDSQM